MFTEEDKAGASILNALFRDAAPAPEASVEAAQDAPAPSDGPAPQSIDLDDLFASTSVSDPADGAPVEKPQSPPPPPPPPAKVPESTDAGLLQLLTPSDTAERLPPTLMDRADFVQHLVVLLCVCARYSYHRRIRRMSINCTPSTALGTVYSTKYLVHHARRYERDCGVSCAGEGLRCKYCSTRMRRSPMTISSVRICV